MVSVARGALRGHPRQCRQDSRPISVRRVVLAFTIDLMRPGQGLGETPIVILGHHVMTHRELGAWRG